MSLLFQRYILWGHMQLAKSTGSALLPQMQAEFDELTRRIDAGER